MCENQPAKKIDKNEVIRGLRKRWAVIIATENQRELNGGRISYIFEERLMYSNFLEECSQNNLTKDQAEDIWYDANREANFVDLSSL